MSEYERNRGLLVPWSADKVERYVEAIISFEMPKFYSSKMEYFEEGCIDYGFQKFNGQWYQIVEKKVTDHDPEYCNLTINSDGTVEYETYHYNGGAHWTEIVDNKLKNLTEDES